MNIKRAVNIRKNASIGIGQVIKVKSSHEYTCSGEYHVAGSISCPESRRLHGHGYIYIYINSTHRGNARHVLNSHFLFEITATTTRNGSN